MFFCWHYLNSCVFAYYEILLEYKFIEDKGIFISSDTSFFDNKIKEITELRDKLVFKEKVVKPVVQEVSRLKEAISGLTEEQKSGLDIADFTEERKTEIIDNFASKYNLSRDKAIEYINEALVRNRDLTINKLKECY